MGLAAIPIALFASSWTLWAAQVCLAILAHTVLGITNPVKASHEEVSISFLTVVFVPFMVI